MEIRKVVPKQPRRMQFVPAKSQGALMSKLDLSDAFRHILVHPADWELLGS